MRRARVDVFGPVGQELIIEHVRVAVRDEAHRTRLVLRHARHTLTTFDG